MSLAKKVFPAVLLLCLLILSAWLLLSPQPAFSLCERIDNVAKPTIGTPYVWGGHSFTQGGFDCSGFIYHIQKSIGRPIPRTTSKKLYLSSLNAPQKLLCGSWIWWTLTPNRPFGHIGIATNNNHAWHSGSTTGPQKITLSSPFWEQHLEDIRYGNK